MTTTEVSGSRIFAELIHAHGVSHVFFVPAILREGLGELAEPGCRSIVDAWREGRRVHGRRLRSRPRATGHLHGPDGWRGQYRRRPEGRLPVVQPRHRLHRRHRARDRYRQVYQEIRDFDMFGRHQVECRGRETPAACPTSSPRRSASPPPARRPGPRRAARQHAARCGRRSGRNAAVLAERRSTLWRGTAVPPRCRRQPDSPGAAGAQHRRTAGDRRRRRRDVVARRGRGGRVGGEAVDSGRDLAACQGGRRRVQSAQRRLLRHLQPPLRQPRRCPRPTWCSSSAARPAA